MDLSKYDLCAAADSGFEMVVRDPYSGKETDAKITVIGSDSKVYRAAKSVAYREAAEGKSEEEISAKVYSKCITSWEGMSDGKDLIEFSEEKAFEVLLKLTWLMDQVGLAVEKRSNFMKKPEKS